MQHQKTIYSFCTGRRCDGVLVFYNKKVPNDDQRRLEYLRQVERHADETGWVAPLTQEDKDHFAYLRKVFKRYNIAPSKATPTEYDFVVGV